MRDWADYEREHGYIRIDLRLLGPEEGGRRKPIFSEYRSCWDIGVLQDGEPMFNDAPLLLESVESVAPGDGGIARIHPVAPQYWGQLQPGATIYAHEGSRRVGIAIVLEVVAPDTGVS